MNNKKEEIITGFNSIQGENKFETIDLFQKDLTPALELTSQGANHPLLDVLDSLLTTLTIMFPICVLYIVFIGLYREEKRSGGPQFAKVREYFDSEVEKGQFLVDEYVKLRKIGRPSKSKNEALNQILENACDNREELTWARIKLKTIEARSKKRNGGKIICDEQAEKELNALMEQTRERLLPMIPH